MEIGNDRKAARRPQPGPRVERLESRDLPTAPTLLAGSTGASLAASLAPSTQQAADVAQVPTPREQLREAFSARFAGSFVTGRGRFTDQASQTFLKGGGNSNAFLHGDLQMAFYPPKDPADPTPGTAALIVKNVSNSGNLLVLDLQGDGQSFDRAGRPTRFTWTVDGSSGGTFSGATGQGTVQISYRPSGRLPGGATGAGSFGATFRGSIMTTSVTNVLRT